MGSGIEHGGAVDSFAFEGFFWSFCFATLDTLLHFEHRY